MIAKPCFVDTVCWVALLNQADDLHQQATRVYRQQFSTGRLLVTTTAVLNETANALSTPRFRSSVVTFYQRLKQSSQVQIIQVDAALWDNGWTLFANRPDKEWSLTDCFSMVVSTSAGIADVLTTDHHFAQAGFHNLLTLR